jgi:MFS family permease
MTEAVDSATEEVADEPRWGDVYRLAAARGISVCGDLLAATALAVTVQQQGEGGFAVAGLLLAASAPPVFLARLVGRLADRLDSRRVMLVVPPLQALCCLAMLTTTSPVALIALNALLATGVAITQPVFSALVPAMVGVRHTGRANAVLQSFTSAGLLIGPALAGLLVGVNGLAIPIVLDAVSFLAVALLCSTIRTRRNLQVATARKAAGDSAADSWRVRKDPVLAVLFALVAFVITAASLMNVSTVFFVRDTLGASAAVYGYVMTCWMLGLVLGSWLAARKCDDDHGYATRLIAGLACISVAILVTGAAPSVAWLYGTFVLGGIGNGLQGTSASVLVARRVEEQHRGMGFAVLGAVINGAMMTGFILGGPLLEVLDPRAVIVVSGALSMVLVSAGALPAWLLSRRKTSTPHAGEDQSV